MRKRRKHRANMTLLRNPELAENYVRIILSGENKKILINLKKSFLLYKSKNYIIPVVIETHFLAPEKNACVFISK